MLGTMVMVLLTFSLRVTEKRIRDGSIEAKARTGPVITRDRVRFAGSLVIA
ncbi:hypothetical protein JCM14469_39870 [Desulfatiferula olefinivorans]